MKWLALIALLGLLALSAAYRRPPGATFFRLMNDRYQEIVDANNGFERSHVPLIAYKDGRFLPACDSDDLGLCIAVPSLARPFHFPAARAYDLLSGGIILLSILIGLLGLRHFDWKLLGFFAIAAMLTIRAGDAYIFEGLPALAALPWVIRFAQERKLRELALACIATALIAGGCELFRIHSGLPYAALVLVLIICLFPRLKAAILIVAVAAAFAVPKSYLNHLIAERDQFLVANGQAISNQHRHIIWHSIYVGLGWVHNSEVPRFADDVGFQRAKTIEPGVVPASEKYEKVIRTEVFRIARQEPWIVAENVVAKFFTILAMLGLILIPATRSFLNRELRVWFDGAFVLAVFIGVVPGILVIPYWRYILNGLACACLYAGFSCTLAQENAGEQTVLAGPQDQHDANQNQGNPKALREPDVFSEQEH